MINVGAGGMRGPRLLYQKQKKSSTRWHYLDPPLTKTGGYWMMKINRYCVSVSNRRFGLSSTCHITGLGLIGSDILGRNGRCFWRGKQSMIPKESYHQDRGYLIFFLMLDMTQSCKKESSINESTN